MFRKWIVQIIVFSCGVAVVSQSLLWAGEERSLEEIRWLVGHWISEDGPSRGEEFWIEPKGGVMLGLARTVSPNRETFFEYLRIEKRDGDIVYVASPMGRRPTEFLMVSHVGTTVVFENTDHDFPQRITYVREGDALTAKISGVMGGEQKSNVFIWRLRE